MKVGTVLVTCPGCGESLHAQIEVQAVRTTAYRLLVDLATAVVEHICEGRDS